MSTKIYNGYISKLNLEQLLKKFIALVPQFDVLFVKKIPAKTNTRYLRR